MGGPAWGWRVGSSSPSEALPSSQGEEVLRQLQTLAPRGVKVRIAVSKPTGPQPQADLQALLQSGELGGSWGWAGPGAAQASTLTTTTPVCPGAQVRMVDMQKLTHGVLHTKFWVVDQTHFYLGSANMDWRSLTQVCLHPAHRPSRPLPAPQGARPPAAPRLNPRVLSSSLCNGVLPTSYLTSPNPALHHPRSAQGSPSDPRWHLQDIPGPVHPFDLHDSLSACLL